MVKILVVPSKEYIEYNRAGYNIEALLANAGTYIERDLAEKDPTHLQIIPYLIVRQGDKIFRYTRLKKTSEERLRSKKSIGIGGHIDFDTSYKSNTEAVVGSCYRELFEELIFGPKDNTTDMKGTVVNQNIRIYQPNNSVGRVHLGLLYTIMIPTNIVINVGEPEKIDGQMINISDLIGEYKSNPEEYEDWSCTALNYLDLGVIKWTQT